MYNLLVIVTMWNKVNKLSRQSYSQAQIAQLLGVHRDTVRRYQSMSEKEFNDHLVREIRRLSLYLSSDTLLETVSCHTTISLTNIVVNSISVVVYTFFVITLRKFLPQNITYGNDKSSTRRWLVKWVVHTS